MLLYAVGAVVEAVIFVVTIAEVEVITPTNERKKHSDGQSMLPGKKPKTHITLSRTTSHTSSLRVKPEKIRRETEPREAKDQKVTTPPQVKSLTTLAKKSSNGMRRQTSRKMMPLKTMVPIAAALLLRAQAPSQEETIRSQESTLRWVQRQTTSRLRAR